MGERPQGIVPAGLWQAAESLGDWTLVGCTVAPGFQFETFEHGREGLGAERLTFFRLIISFAAISPPPAISAAAMPSETLAVA